MPLPPLRGQGQPVVVLDGSGDQITSFGGGTQYTEGDTDASITGNALLFEGAGNTIVAAPGDATNGLDVDVTRLPAGTNLLGKIAAGLDTTAIYEGATALTPKFAVIDCATSGDNTIITAVASKKIRVLSGMLIASAAVTARFESGASGTALTGQMQLAANAGFPIPFCPLGQFETAVNTLLNLELSGAVSVDGWLVYVEVA